MMRKFLSLLLFVLMAFPFSGLAGQETEADAMELSLYAINVRKADALLLRSGNSAYLIDTGSEDSERALLKALEKEGITHLDGVILTHTHQDHIGGFPALMESGIEIDRIYASGYMKKKNVEKHPIVKALKNTNREVIFLTSGDTLPLDGGTLEVLGPREKSDTENNNSLVLLATGGGGSMLLAGDMEFPEEESLMAAGLIPHADVLKIGNHGEDDATSEAFVDAVRPSVAVISTSTADEPDTPSARIMLMLERRGIQVYQTQETENGVLITLRNGEIAAESK